MNSIFNGGNSELDTSSETSSLQGISAEQFCKLCGSQHVIIRRSKIIRDALNFYKSKHITSRKLHVKFDALGDRWRDKGTLLFLLGYF